MTIPFLAEVLSDASAQWLIAGAGAVMFLAVGTNAIFGVLLKRKALHAPPGQFINPQPFLIELKKEFVTVPMLEKHAQQLAADLEEHKNDMHNQLKDLRAYAHQSNHDIRGDIQGIMLAGQGRDELLHKLDERTITHTRVMEGFTTKLDRMVDRMADKVEELLRRDGGGRRS